MYGWDARVPTSLDFYVPPPRFPVIQADYAKEMFKDVKQARQLAQKVIKQAQMGQKYQYDKTSKKISIKEGDIVMLKVELRFKLDQSYKGPYRVKEVTPTNVFIQQINDPNGEVLDVSIQRVSKCSSNLEAATPWLGHGVDVNSKELRLVVHQVQADPKFKRAEEG